MKLIHKAALAVAATATTALLFAPAAMAAGTMHPDIKCTSTADVEKITTDRHNGHNCPTSPSVSPSPTASPTASPSPSATPSPSASATGATTTPVAVAVAASLPVTGGDVTIFVVTGLGLVILGIGALVAGRQRS